MSKNPPILLRAAVLGFVLLGACGAPYAPVPEPALPPEVGDGETIYFGHVFPLAAPADAASPTYIYERRVAERGGAMRATHITREPAGRVVLADSATHDADYRLREYTLHGDQLGQRGTVRVEAGVVSFHLISGTEERSGSEPLGDPVVVGPTLVGHIVRQLGALRAGAVLPVRLAALDRLETLGFELQAIPAAPGQTQVRMKASSLVLALAVPPVLFTFETQTGKLVRIEGRVPTKVRSGDRWRDFDARVEYEYVAGAYR